MKSILLGLSLVLCLSACKESADKTKTGTASKEQSATTSSSGVESASCGAMAYFKKNAVFVGENFNAAGVLTSSQETTIIDVREENGTLVGKAEMKFTGAKTAKTPLKNLVMEFKCDGKNIYSDPKQTMANFEMLKDAEVNSSALSFPIAPVVGQELPGGFMELKIKRGNMNMVNKTTYSNRQVESKEEVQTKAGSFSCFKIVTSMDMKIEMGDSETEKQMAAGMNKALKSGKMIMWYAPNFGFVKTEMYQDGKLQSRSEVSSIKM